MSNNTGDIRELSLDDVDAVSGAFKVSFLGITIAIKEEGVTGISVGGANGIGAGVVDGQVCGYIGSHGGCI